MAKASAALTKELERSPMVEELHFRSDNAFLCLLLNRRSKQIRVIDFRAGALPAKRLYIQSVAQREGVEKIIILVEKDEVTSWTRVGFVREGTVPGFYKRSDGHLVGCVISDRTASIEVTDATQRTVERTINAAKKRTASIGDVIKGVVLKGVDVKTAEKARDAVWKKGTETLGTFDSFGRDALRLYLETTPQKGKANYISAEFQECFGHSLMEILRVPKTDPDILAVAAALRSFNEELTRREIVSAFSFTPYDNVELAASFIAAGYRKTGLLAKGVLCAGERTDAILWSRKLADPSGGVSDDDDDDE